MSPDRRFKILYLTITTTVIFVSKPVYTSDLVSWNSSHPDWKVYQAKWCGFECRNGVRLRHDYGCKTPVCFPCDCDEHCSLLGTCCPTLDADTKSYHYNIETSKDANPFQWYDKISCNNPTPNPNRYLSVVKCPSSWSDQELRNKCERPTSDSMASVTPFSDKTTGLVFPNAHCAVCNGLRLPATRHNFKNKFNNADKRFVYPWPIQIRCSHFQNLYRITDEFEFYKQASRLKECTVKFEPPFYKRWSPRSCAWEFDTSPTNTVCTSSDETLDRLCHTLPPYPTLAVTGYRNIFCFMCNGSTPETLTCSSITSQRILNRDEVPSTRFVPPLYLLFRSQPYYDRVSEMVLQPDAECTPGQWTNEEGECAPASCSPGKLLENTTCKTAISDINGLGYTVHLVLIPQNQIKSGAIESLLTIIRERLTEGSAASNISATVVTLHCLNSYESMMEYRDVLEIRVYGYVIASPTLARDEFEERYVRSIVEGPWDLTVDLAIDVINVTLEVDCVGVEMCRSHQEFHQNKNFIPPEVDMWHPLGNDCYTNENSVVLKQPIFDLDIMQFIFKYYSNYSPKDQWNNLIDINPSLTCPFVEFNLTTSSTRVDNGSYTFTVLIRNQELNVTQDNMRISLLDGKLKVCLDLLKEWELNLEQNVILEMDFTGYKLYYIAFYIETVCEIISIIFFLISIITYCLFPSLRRLPGLNNMCLCISMVVATITSFLVLIARASMHEISCFILAIVVHYSWLCSFCWMNTCCIHMYRVFTSNRGPSTWSDVKTHRHYCLYAFGIPAGVVIGTSIITSAITDGDSIGYSSRTCLFDFETSALIAILAFIVPFFITMAVNFVLFFLTVKEIVHVTRQTPAPNKDSHGVMIYVKLSTLTGMFWILYATGALLRSPVLVLIACPLVGLQGFFIFMSFIFNKHVGTLYKELISGRSQTDSSSSTMNTNYRGLRSKSNSTPTKSSHV